MTDDDKQRLQHIVERYAELFNQIDGHKDKIKTCTDEQKELATVASERLGLPAKQLKQLVAEFRMGAEDRAELRRIEDIVDQCRLSLGLLADTPLGMAAQQFVESVRNGEADVKIGDGQWLSEQITGQPKKRGRPKGSKNKPKAAIVETASADVPDFPELPDMPNDPFTAEAIETPAIPDWPQ